MMFHARLLAPTMVLMIAAPTFADNFIGTYTAKSDDGLVTMTLNQDGENVTGTFLQGTDNIVLTGRVSEDGKRVSGKLAMNGQELPLTFEIRREGDKLRYTLQVAGEEDVLIFTPSGSNPKPVPARPKHTKITKPVDVTKPEPPETKTPAVAGETYRHPGGLRLSIPKGWRMYTVGVIALLPPGATPTSGEGCAVILTDGSGDAVIEKLEQKCMEAPSYRKIETGGPGFTYEGDTNGVTTRVRCLTIANDAGNTAIFLITGPKPKMPAREQALVTMVKTAKWAAPEMDGRLVGTWSGGLVTKDQDVKGTGGKYTVTGATDSSTTYNLAPNGVFEEITTSRSIFNGQGVSIDTGDTVKKESNRWAASGGILSISNDGTYYTGTYRFAGDQLIVQLADKTLAMRRQ